MTGVNLTVFGIQAILVIMFKYYGFDVFAVVVVLDVESNLNNDDGFLHGGCIVLDVKYDNVGDGKNVVVFYLPVVIAWPAAKQKLLLILGCF